MLWVKIRDSLWFVPAALTLLGAGLAVLLVQVEREGAIPWNRAAEQWLLSGDADGARQLLSAIATGLMTVTGVAFSVTVVALQLASSQFTPRVLRNFSADRANQIVLGVLIGTFTYAVLVLRTIRSGGANAEEFVPRLAVTVGVALALISIGWLIYFINHAASSMRVSVILDRVSAETLRHVRQYFPEPFHGETATWAEDEPPADESQVVPARKAGYLQAVDTATLFQLGQRGGLRIRMTCEVGQFLLRGQPLAHLTPPGKADEEMVHAICQAFVIGDERTPKQDIEFGIIEIADIAIKALSPSINDPTTAMRCIDRLTQILQELGHRRPAAEPRTEDGSTPFLARHLQYERAVGLAFDQIRHFGASNPAISKKLLGSLAVLITLVPKERHPPLIAQAEAVLEDTRRSTEASAARRDLERLEAEFWALCQRVGSA
jgi:uncharacterized membrane protein